MSIRNLNGQDFEIDFEELVRIISEEVISSLLKKSNNIIRRKDEYAATCSNQKIIFNPSCCSITEISREYILSAKSEVSSIMAL